MEKFKTTAEKWTGKIYELTIGATKKEGGTRTSSIKIGGENCLPFMHYEGDIPNSPKIAMEVWDTEPKEWPDILRKPFGKSLKSPFDWAKKSIEEFGIDFICLRLISTHPDWRNTSVEESKKFVEKFLKEINVPLIILGSNNIEKDQDLIAMIAEVSKGENCLLGIAVEGNYKTITAACMSCGHSIIAETPIDINLAKQLNILITDMGFPQDRIVIHNATGALGYGLEYTYSIMERTRLAALGGDKLLSQPMINFVGWEVWKTKEAKATEEEMPEWGGEIKRGEFWETVTAISYLQAGADLLVMNHPDSIKRVKEIINDLMEKEMRI
jgi:acetyl-CoA decarbonylase/synthase complex subunit delta